MKRLLIVVDMLNDFCSTGGALAKSIITGEYYGRDIAMNVLGRVSEYRDAQDLIIWLGDAHAEDDVEFKRFPKHAIRNSWGAAIIDALNPSMVDASAFELYIPKTRHSGFYGTDLEYQLTRTAPFVPVGNAIEASMASPLVEVCGVCTSICVMDTVGGLVNRDYDIVIHEDCVADFDPEAHEAALERMESLYGVTII